jgi:predicted glycoside hydrolase/deacetylase ChbG (UPF0249 family)
MALLPIITHADDFGYGPHVNAGIVEAFAGGLLARTSILANMPGFEEACALARDNGLEAQVGVHVNLTEGVPLTEEIRRSHRFCTSEGRLWKWRNRHVLWLTSTERRMVYAEVTAQIRRCRDHGLRVQHLDSHHHVHTQPVLARLITTVARELGITSIRIARNCGRSALTNRLYKDAYNFRLRRMELAATRYFGGPEDLEHFVAAGATPAQLASFELITHPVLRDDGVVVDVDSPGIALAESLTLLVAGSRSLTRS